MYIYIYARSRSLRSHIKNLFYISLISRSENFSLPTYILTYISKLSAACAPYPTLKSITGYPSRIRKLHISHRHNSNTKSHMATAAHSTAVLFLFENAISLCPVPPLHLSTSPILHLSTSPPLNLSTLALYPCDIHAKEADTFLLLGLHCLLYLSSNVSHSNSRAFAGKFLLTISDNPIIGITMTTLS